MLVRRLSTRCRPWGAALSRRRAAQGASGCERRAGSFAFVDDTIFIETIFYRHPASLANRAEDFPLVARIRSLLWAASTETQIHVGTCQSKHYISRRKKSN